MLVYKGKILKLSFKKNGLYGILFENVIARTSDHAAVKHEKKKKLQLPSF